MPVVIPLAALVAALVALLVLYAAGTVGKMFAAFIPSIHIPLVGNLRSIVTAGINTGLTWVEDAMDDTIAPLSKFMTAVIARPEAIYNSIAALAGRARGVMAWIVETYIPREVSALNRSIASAKAAAESYAASKVSTVTKTLSADYAALHHYSYLVYGYAITAVNAAKAAAEAYTRAEIAALTKTVAADLAAAEAYTKTAIAALSTTVTKDVTALNATVTAGVSTATAAATKAAVSAATSIAASASTDVSAVAGYVDLEASKALTAVWPDIITAVDGAIDVAGTADTDITDALGRVARAVPTDLVGALTGVGAISLAMTRYLEDCGIPNCRNLSGLGRDLAALLDLVEDASFLALIIALISDPADGARLVDDTLGGLADATMGTAKTLFGVG